MINEFVAFCDKMYKRTCKCPKCGNDCKGGCEECLKTIHFSPAGRSYNCKNIAAFYGCKYSYKYSSEIDILLSKQKPLQSLTSFNVISIGCGPCTEFIGLHRYLNRKRSLYPIRYVGFDLNSIWKPIHSFYSNYFSNSQTNKVRFFYSDALKIIPTLDFSKTEKKPNILFLQYVLSDMVKSNIDVKKFMNALMQKVIPFMPVNSFILLNDINHFSATDWFDYFDSKCCSQFNFSSFKGHFPNDNRRAAPYGHEHDKNNLTCEIPRHIIAKYNPWAFCSSAHLVLKKKD